MGQLDGHSNEDSPVMMSSPDILLLYNPTLEFVESDLVMFRMRYGLLDSAWLRLPLNGEIVDWSIPGWLPTYKVPFKIGLHLSFPHRVTGVMSWYEITHGQLMPNFLEDLALLGGFGQVT